jgi:hypothetical protein
MRLASLKMPYAEAIDRRTESLPRPVRLGTRTVEPPPPGVGGALSSTVGVAITGELEVTAAIDSVEEYGPEPHGTVK